MNIYKISQTTNNGFNTFDSAIVVANNQYEARRMKPIGPSSFEWMDDNSFNQAWANQLLDVNVELLDKYTGSKTEPHLLNSSFTKVQHLNQFDK